MYYSERKKIMLMGAIITMSVICIFSVVAVAELMIATKTEKISHVYDDIIYTCNIMVSGDVILSPENHYKLLKITDESVIFKNKYTEDILIFYR